MFTKGEIQMKKRELLYKIEHLEDRIKALENYIKTPYPININDIIVRKGEGDFCPDETAFKVALINSLGKEGTPNGR